MVCRHSSCGRRNGREGGHRITGRRRIASSRHHKRLAEKALHAKTKFKLIPTFITVVAAKKNPKQEYAPWGSAEFVASLGFWAGRQGVSGEKSDLK